MAVKNSDGVENGARVVTPAELTEDLSALGVRDGQVLLVHMSFRSVRPVHGGPSGVIEALLHAVGPRGTLVMPSWGDDDDSPFDPDRTAASSDLGVTAEIFRRMPNVKRSAHPFAFAALGPNADAVTAGPLPIPPHAPTSPVGRVHDLDGQVLLLGVGHDSDSTIHLAEVLGGVPYGVPKHCTVMRDGQPTRVDYDENDHCCQRFALADDWLRQRGLQREGKVGHAHARLIRSRDIVSVVLEQLARDPLVFLHDSIERCEECDRARASFG
jgi:aminoglycoside 3-N-acetyltransferase